MILSVARRTEEEICIYTVYPRGVIWSHWLPLTLLQSWHIITLFSRMPNKSKGKWKTWVSTEAWCSYLAKCTAIIKKRWKVDWYERVVWMWVRINFACVGVCVCVRDVMWIILKGQMGSVQKGASWISNKLNSHCSKNNNASKSMFLSITDLITSSQMLTYFVFFPIEIKCPCSWE